MDNWKTLDTLLDDGDKQRRDNNDAPGNKKTDEGEIKTQPMYSWQWAELADWIVKNAKHLWNDKLDELIVIAS